MAIFLSAITSILLGVVSNYVYDILKNRGTFPDKLTVKFVVVIVFMGLPLVLFFIWSDIPVEIKEAIQAIVEINVPIWIAALALVFSMLLAFIIANMKINRLRMSLMQQKEQLQDTERRLKNSETMLSQYLASTRQRDSIIRPK